MVAWWRALDQVAMEESMFFFEKKNQKTFAPWAEPVRKGRSQTSKSFLLLFFKKEGLDYPTFQ
jgi:hypothetical protein